MILVKVVQLKSVKEVTCVRNRDKPRYALWLHLVFLPNGAVCEGIMRFALGELYKKQFKSGLDSFLNNWKKRDFKLTKWNNVPSLWAHEPWACDKSLVNMAHELKTAQPLGSLPSSLLTSLALLIPIHLYGSRTYERTPFLFSGSD